MSATLNGTVATLLSKVKDLFVFESKTTELQLVEQ